MEGSKRTLQAAQERAECRCRRHLRSEPTSTIERDFCLPTALGCQFIEAAISVDRRFLADKACAYPFYTLGSAGRKAQVQVEK
jgi:signal-transduction protein with cAMP-binding, CBS, and nucleotidyltransferase domain